MLAMIVATSVYESVLSMTLRNEFCNRFSFINIIQGCTKDFFSQGSQYSYKKQPSKLVRKKHLVMYAVRTGLLA